jgi:large subunit ribosomal protein L3
MKHLIGKKREMTQVFKENGSVVPVTLVFVPPCCVTQVKINKENGSLEKIQIESGEKKKIRKEFFLDSTKDFSFEVGQVLDVTMFEIGDQITVVGTSKGRGFAGVVKRHGFSGGPKTHGHKDQERMPGSIASHRQGPVAKGKRMAGRMGGDQVTIKNLEIISIEPEKHLLGIKGAIPGARESFVFISHSTG